MMRRRLVKLALRAYPADSVRSRGPEMLSLDPPIV